MTFRQQLLSSSNCCLLFSARCRHREQQIVVDVAQLVGPSSRFMTPWLSCRILTASRIHLVVLSDSLAMIVASFQLMTWFSWLTWSVIADLFCCDCFLELLVYLRPLVPRLPSDVPSYGHQSCAPSLQCRLFRSVYTGFCPYEGTSEGSRGTRRA